LRAVTTATAAAVLSLDRKKLDNLLSRIGTDGLSAGRQGVERRIPVAMLEDIALTAELADGLSVPARAAYAIARQLLGRESRGQSRGAFESAIDNSTDNVAFIGSMHLGPFVHLGVNLLAFRAELHARLELAIESQVRPRRGRPRRLKRARVAIADSGEA